MKWVLCKNIKYVKIMIEGEDFFTGFSLDGESKSEKE